MTPMDFRVTRSKINVTVTFSVKTVSDSYLVNVLVYVFQTWQKACTWQADDPYWFLGHYSKGQGHSDLQGKNGFRSITSECFVLGSYFIWWLISMRTWSLLILGFSRSKVKVAVCIFVKLVSRSISWEPFIAEPSYFTWWLCSMKTWSLLILGSVG